MNKVLPNRFPEIRLMTAINEEQNCLPIEHGVKCRNLVNSHRRHAEEVSDVVHDADTCPSFVLTLSEIKQRNNGGFLVLRRIVRDNFLSSLHVFGIELESNLPN